MKKVNYVLLGFIIIMVIATVYGANNDLTLDSLNQRIDTVEKSMNTNYVSIDNKVALLRNEIKSLKSDVQILKEEKYSPTKGSWTVYGIFLAMICGLFALNISTMYRMKSLKTSSPQTIAKKKREDVNKVKKFIDYCKYQKGMNLPECKKLLLQRGWTQDQIEKALK